METKKFQRHVAMELRIRDILSAEYFAGDDSQASYILNNNQQIYRINVLGIVIKNEEIGSITNIFIDDGSGNIITRFFEENKNLKKISIGDVVLIVGKVRKYNEEKYISPEIIKITNPLWLKIRTLNLTNLFQEKDNDEKIIINDQTNNDDNKNNKEEIINLPSENLDDVLLPIEKILNLIKELDHGNGVPIEDIIEKSPLEGTQTILDKMLEKGDIFQNQPGKIKVL